MREIRTLRATWRGLETWNGQIATAAGAPVLDPTCERLGVRLPGPTPLRVATAASPIHYSDTGGPPIGEIPD